MSIDRELAQQIVAEIVTALTQPPPAPEPSAAPVDDLRAFSYAEAGERLGNIGEAAVENMVARGQLQSVRAGRKRLIPARSLQQFLDGRPECHDDDDQTEPAPSTNVRTIGGRRKGTYQLPRARGERRG